MVNDPFLGEVRLIFDGASRQPLLRRELSGGDRTRLIRLAQESAKQRLMAHSHLLPLMDYSFGREKSLCATRYTLRQYFECPRVELRREIDRRAQASQLFSALELTMLLYQLLGACEALQEARMSHGSISPVSVVLRPGSTEGGLRLFFDEPLQPQKYMEALLRRIVMKLPLNASPAAFEAVVKRQKSFSVNLVVEDAFAIGLLLLEAGTFQSTARLYAASGDFDRQRLSLLLGVFRKRYDKDSLLLTNCVSFLLEKQPAAKISFSEILSHLPPYQDMQAYSAQVLSSRVSRIPAQPRQPVALSVVPPVSLPPYIGQQAVSNISSPRQEGYIPSPDGRSQSARPSFTSPPPISPRQSQRISSQVANSAVSLPPPDPHSAALVQSFWGALIQPEAAERPSIQPTDLPTTTASRRNSYISSNEAVQPTSSFPESEPARNIFADLKIENANALQNFFFPSKRNIDPPPYSREPSPKVSENRPAPRAKSQVITPITSMGHTQPFNFREMTVTPSESSFISQNYFSEAPDRTRNKSANVDSRVSTGFQTPLNYPRVSIKAANEPKIFYRSTNSSHVITPQVINSMVQIPYYQRPADSFRMTNTMHYEPHRVG